MSKSFRNRPVDYTKSLPIYMNDELPDIADYTAINRSVPQMPSGMEKEEEAEHHLQRALSAQTVYGSSSSSDYAIPTPKVKPVDSEKYDRIYAAECPKYTTYIRLQPFGNDIEYPEYDCDTEDEAWLASNPSVTVDTFEDIMDRLEKATGYSTNLMTYDEAKPLFNEIDANLLTSVYEYWRAKRLRLKHPLTPTVLTDKSGMTTQPNNPYLVFRRRTEKMQTRKNRKNEEQSYEKMLILKRDLMRAQSLFNLIKKRESFKKDYLKLVMEIFEKRYKANDFDGTLTADHQMHMQHVAKQVSLTSHQHHPAANASSIASSSSSSLNQRQFLASNSNQNQKPAILHHHPHHHHHHHLSNKSNKQNASNMLKKKALVTHKSSSHYSSSISHPHINHHMASIKSTNKKSSQVSSMPLAKGSLCQSSSSSSSSSSTCSTISAIASTHLAAPPSSSSISLANSNEAKSPHKRLSRDIDHHHHHHHHQANSAHVGVAGTSERLTPNELENIEALLNETMNALSTSVESDGYWVFRRKEGCNYLAPQQKPLLHSSAHDNTNEQKMRGDCGSGIGSEAKWGYVRTSRNRHLGLVRRRLGRGGRVILDRFDAAVNATSLNCLKFDSYRANNRPIDYDENEHDGDGDATTCDYTYFNMQLQQLKSKNSNTIGSSRCINNSNVNGRVVRMHRHHPYYNDAICNRRQRQHDYDNDLSALDDECDDNYELLNCGDDDMDEDGNDDDDEQHDANQSDEDSNCDEDKNKDERDTNKRANDADNSDNHNNDEKLNENNCDMNEINEEVASNNNNNNNSNNHNSNSNDNSNNNNNSGDDINNNSMMNSNLNTTIDEAMVPQQQQHQHQQQHQNNNSDLNENKLKSCNLYAAYRSFSDEYRSEASDCVLDKISVRHALASLHHHKASSVSLYSQAANQAAQQTKPAKVIFHTNNENSNSNLDENETSSLSAVKLLAINTPNGNINANSNGLSSNGNVLSHITLNNTPANAITLNVINSTNNIQLNTSTNMNSSNNLNSNLNVNGALNGAASSPIVNIVNLNNHNKLSATKKTASAINLIPNGNNAASSLLANVPIKLIANSTANSISSSSAITGTVSNSSMNVISVNGGSTGGQVASQSAPNGLNILSLANGAVKKDLDHENSNTVNSFKVAPSAVHVNLNGSSTVATAVATSSVKKISQQQQHHQKLYHFGQGVTTSSPVVNSNTFNVVYKMPIAANHHHHHHHHHTDSQTSTSKIL